MSGGSSRVSALPCPCPSLPLALAPLPFPTCPFTAFAARCLPPAHPLAFPHTLRWITFCAPLPPAYYLRSSSSGLHRLATTRGLPPTPPPPPTPPSPQRSVTPATFTVPRPQHGCIVLPRITCHMLQFLRPACHHSFTPHAPPACILPTYLLGGGGGGWGGGRVGGRWEVTCARLYLPFVG